jgi:SAM-dependent methyltransferase
MVGTAQALPFPDASFAAVFAHTLLEHMPEPLAVVREMRRVLVPRGVLGVRDGDTGARLLYPPDRAVQDAVALYERFWEHNGGHPQQGREQRALLHTAGFRDLQTSAGTATAHPIRDAADYFAGRLTGPPLADTTLALGWTDRPTLERYAQVLRTWAQHPDALWTTIMVESVGWAE